jgi:hypothetical protein
LKRCSDTISEILENVSITTAILKIGSFIPQNVFALAEEALHGGTGRHRRVVPHKKFGQNWPTHVCMVTVQMNIYYIKI